MKWWQYTVFAIVVTAAAASLVWGIGERAQLRRYERSTVTVTDTVWREIHDTAFVERSRTLVRHDTVRLAAVNPLHVVTPCDTAAVDYNLKSDPDSVDVSVPISLSVFEGEDYRITASGYRVSLVDVWMRERVITQTNTVTRPKRWAFGIGVQAGYGITMHGLSPYAGVGISFGYVF